jgi:hypothetical protein
LPIRLSLTFNNGKAKRTRALDHTAAHAVRINQRLLLGDSSERTIECLELPQEQTSARVALMSQNDPKRTYACRVLSSLWIGRRELKAA